MRTLNTLITLSLISVCAGLSGCTGMFNNEARCPFSDQGGCQSVNAVDAQVRARHFTPDGEFVAKRDAAPSATAAATPGLQPTGWQSPTPYVGQPLRTQEQVSDVWVAPWVDTHGVRHGSSVLQFVVRPAGWANNPVAAIHDHLSDEED